MTIPLKNSWHMGPMGPQVMNRSNTRPGGVVSNNMEIGLVIARDYQNTMNHGGLQEPFRAEQGDENGMN